MKCFVLLSCVLLTACATQDPGCPKLPEIGAYCLQPADAVRAFTTQQKIELSFKDRRETMISSIEAGSTSLRFAALSPLGQKLIQIDCDPKNVSATLWPETRLEPAMLCAMIQLTLWPAQSAAQGLSSAELREEGEWRRIIRGADTPLQIRRIGARPPYERIELNMPTLELKLDIETLPETRP